MDSADIAAALAQLDEEIAAAEVLLADLRLQRRGAEAILARLPMTTKDEPAQEDTGAAAAPKVRRRGTGDNSQHGLVKAVIIDHDIWGRFDTKSIQRIVRDEEIGLTPVQVSNALVALRRQGFIDKAENGPRGLWVREVPGEAEQQNGPTGEVRPFPTTPVVRATG